MFHRIVLASPLSTGISCATLMKGIIPWTSLRGSQLKEIPLFLEIGEKEKNPQGPSGSAVPRAWGAWWATVHGIKRIRHNWGINTFNTYYLLLIIFILLENISDIQFSSVTQLCLTLCNPMECSTPGLQVHRNSWSLLKLMSIKSVMPSNRLILCCPLLLLSSIFTSIRVFSSESVLCIRWPKYWSFSISLSNEYSGLTSFRIDWFDLLAVQGTLKSHLQHHSSKTILRLSASFMLQLTSIHDYWKNHSFD